MVYEAYLRVHSAAVLSCSTRFVLSLFAISGTSGSSGFASVSNEQIDNKTENVCNQFPKQISTPASIQL